MDVFIKMYPIPTAWSLALPDLDTRDSVDQSRRIVASMGYNSAPV